MKIVSRGLVVIIPAVLATGLLSAHPGEYHNYSGGELYARFCASCHGVSGAGDGPVVEALAVHVPDLREISVRGGNRFSRDWLYRIIDGRVSIVAHGTRAMPVWGTGFYDEYGADAKAQQKVDKIIGELADYIISIQIPAREN